jgi:hypothetical protein
MITSDSEARFVGKIFDKSTILSDINKSLLYFNLPFDSILKERHLPSLIFPQQNLDVKLPLVS